MDKSWMSMPRTTLEYMNGLHTFLNFSFSSPCCQDGKILCPCKTCFNRHWMSRKDAFEHLICVGFVKNYTHWVLHGESSFHASSSMPNEDHENVGINNDVEDLLNDMARSVQPEAHTEEPNADALKFYKLVDANQTELYPGCTRHSKLSFIIRLFHVKCLGRWSVKSFTMLLELLREVIPNGENLPKSYHEVKKFISDLGLSYETIDACRNDCMLFWKNHINESNCLICGADRWKSTPSNAVGTAKKKTHNVPFKRLRYFPLGPRLQRLFMSADTATLMRWHAEKRADDGILRHPADSPAWKTFDYRHQEFATQPRNVRLGLASDGFNPFRSMNLSHSTWPVVMVPYNLPPWLYMKQPYMFLSLLIPGPQSPGNDIDVYLQPLVEELKDLWYNGIETYDASLKQNFQMKAALMWTISDFPGYAMLSGWSTKGRLACPACNKQTHSQWLKYGRKFCYLGHRRFLPSRHVFRRYKKSFDNQQEFRPAPKPLSGSDVLADLQGRQITFGKKSKNNHLPYAWKKRSIFFDLPYWVDNLLRHNLDVMHIEKNVCDNILWTLLNVNGRSKDSVKSRLDLQLMGIRGELHPQRHESGKMYVPPACFTLSAKERLLLCKALKGVKQLLPLMIRRLLPKPISGPLIQLCSFFKDLCSKTGEIDKLNNLEHQISLTLCQLERIFPPSFFDVMVHLTVHLVSEVKLGGPVQGRWMYPIERFLSTLKSYVGNKAQPEGSITEGYLAEECLTFCSRYLKGVETRLNRTPRNEDNNTYGADIVNQEEVNSFFHHSGRPIGKGDLVIMDNETLAKAHQYVLANCPLVNPFIEQHLALLRSQYPRATPHTIHAKHHATFQSWFANQELVVDVETYLQSETLNAAFSEDVTHEDDVTWTRDGMHGDLVDATVENPVDMLIYSLTMFVLWVWCVTFATAVLERRRVAKENRKNLPSGHTMGTKSCARVRHEMRLAAPGKEEPSRADVYIATHIRRDGKPLNEEVACYIEKMKEIQTHLPTSGDDHGPNDVYSQVLGRKKSRSTSTYGLGSTRGGKNSRMSIVREALEAKKSAEEEVQRVQQEIGKLREGQTKILALIQKNNPDLNLDDVVASPIRDDIDLNHNFIEDDSNLVQQEDNLGVGPFLAMLQSSSETSETDANNETTNSLMDIFVPLSRNIPTPKESTAATSNDPFLHYMLNTYQEKDSQQQPMDMTEEDHNVTNSSTQGLTYCYLRSLNQPNVDVAKGSIVSKNPKRIVGDVELGGGFYEIFVEVPMKPDEPLVRPYGSFSVIGDVTGRTIAWPSILVNRLYVDTLFS
ncbi:hypothetical protein LINPERHAP2_LOCUS5479 [Linum perenne]